MNTNLLRRVHKNKKVNSIGRGGKRGKTAGRGTKGQGARAGRKIRPELRDFIKRLPKLRGRGKNSNQSIQDVNLVVNIADIETNFKAGEKVTKSQIIARGLVRDNQTHGSTMKILGKGELTKKLTVEGCLVSAEAKAKIEKVGGTVKA